MSEPLLTFKHLLAELPIGKTALRQLLARLGFRRSATCGKLIFTRDQVYWWLRKLTKRLGVAFTPHMARHEFGSLIRDDRALVEVGTWTNEKSTRRYVHGDRDFKRATLSKVKGG